VSVSTCPPLKTPLETIFLHPPPGLPKSTGVPSMTPVDELIDSPAGRPLGIIKYLWNYQISVVFQWSEVTKWIMIYVIKFV
jgi:hypothetical protein